MTLEQRLGHAGGETKTGIGLVGAPVVQVGCQRVTDESSHEFSHLVTPLEAGPNGNVPGGDPAAACLTRFHPFPDGIRQLPVAA